MQNNVNVIEKNIVQEKDFHVKNNKTNEIR